MPGGKRVRPAHYGDDRRFGRSLAETLNAGKQRITNTPNDWADPHGIPRPDLSGIEELDDWATEDVEEERYWRQARKNEALGYPEDYEGDRGY